MGGHGGEVKSAVASKPHVVLLMVPAPGHMFPNLALGRALARRGVKVTVLCSGVVSEKLRHDVEEGAEDVDMSIQSVVDDPLPEPDHPSNLMPWLWKLKDEEMVAQSAQAIQRLSPKPCCFVTDLFLGWTALLEPQIGIPRHFLITMSASSLAFLFSVPLFRKQGRLPLDLSLDVDVELPVPGVGNVPKGAVWEYLRKGFFPVEGLLEDFLGALQNFTEAFPTATYLVNSAEELEPEVCRALREPILFTGEVAKIVPVGPLEQSFASKGGEADSFMREVEKNKKLPSEMLEWLDEQPDNSVVYITFGTIFSLQAEQILEMAHAVEASGQRFLWILRPPETPQVIVSKQPTKEEISALLPPGFEERTKGRGMLYSSWAPQPKILAHKAVGLFMTHCGWNSILEAISTSTPILGSPCFLDQYMNATLAIEKLQIGKLLRNSEDKYERGHIEMCIRQIMNGEEGRHARSNVAKLNKALRNAATSSTGSSSKNLDQYADEIVTMHKKLNHSQDF